MTVTGTVKGEDGRNINNYAVTVTNGSGENVLNQNFTGQFVLDAIPGYSYWFNGIGSGYGAILKDGSDLINGSVIILPKNFDTLSPGNNKMIYAAAGGLGIVLLMLKEKKKKVGKIETSEILPIILIGAALIGFNLIQKLLTSLGIWSSQDTKTLDSLAGSSSAQNFWKPDYYLQFSSYPGGNITTPQAVDMVNMITSSFGMFNDCEDCVIGIFRNLKTKSNVSFLSKVFFDQTGKDLLTYLRGGLWPEDHLSDADVNTINSFLSTLPTN